jgi:hypothetical protein
MMLLVVLISGLGDWGGELVGEIAGEVVGEVAGDGNWGIRIETVM